MQLYDQFGRVIQKEKAPERRTLAAAPILDSWREYVTAGLTPQILASLLKEADAGDVRRQSEMFDQMEEKDAHILGEKSKRQNVILDLDFKISPASEDARDVKVAEFIEEFIDNFTEYDDVMVSLQDAVGKGFSATEIFWDVSAGQALPEKLEFIEQKRLLFTDKTGILRRHPLLISDDELMGAEIPAWKTIFHRYGGKSGHSTRSGIYRVCAWMYLFKNYAIKDWVAFAEVYGMPLRLGKYDPGADKADKAALITAIQSLGSDAAGIISKSTEIEFIESVRGKATGELYEALASFANRENSKALLGQTLSAEVGDKGSYAAAKVHNGVRLDLIKADARALAGSIRHQLIRPIVGFNFGWDTDCPGYEAVWEESEDLTKKSEWVGNLLERGVEMPVSFVRSEFNIPEPDGDEPIIGTRVSAGDVSAAKLIAKIIARPGAAGDLSPADVLKRIGNKALSTAGVDDMMKPIETLLAKAESLEEFRDGLPDLLADMDESSQGDLMQQAFLLAELSGRFDAS